MGAKAHDDSADGARGRHGGALRVGVFDPTSQVSAGREQFIVAGERAVIGYRFLTLAYAAVLMWTWRDEMTRPAVVVGALVVLLAWAVVQAVIGRLRPAFVAIELVLVVAAIMSAWAAFPRDVIVGGAPTVPGIVAGAPVIGGALLWGVRGGLAAVVPIAIADVVVVHEPNGGTWHNIVLLIVLGTIVGLAASTARASHALLVEALRAKERLDERERLNRIVHDGVLQTLTFIHRRGGQIGGAAVELADLAAAQERDLRTFVTRARAAGDPERTEDTERDLATTLARHRSPTVDVALPVGPVRLPERVVAEVDAAVRAALDNVDAHAGEGALAWILVEDLGREVAVTVRDNGAGMADGRLDEAASDGRMGVSSSIRGRIEDLGGRAEWRSRPGHGCTVSLTVPRASPGDSTGRPPGATRGTTRENQP
ncbi:MacS family sensor histidine kinase [Janibacter sp. G1551]|uniref:MacS family sensor histidine kinase n=1 Tax=Janibacter sp. G1551 TaxID=3420440 RepID=UPI003D0031FF